MAKTSTDPDVPGAPARGRWPLEAPTGGHSSLDVLIVSLGATGGLRRADEELLGSLLRAGASAAIVRPAPPPPVRTLALTDLRWALAARSAAAAEIERTRPRAVIYSSITAALLWPRPGAIRFDAPAAGNRPGRHGLWQRPLERRRLREAPLLLPWSAESMAELGRSSGELAWSEVGRSAGGPAPDDVGHSTGGSARGEPERPSSGSARGQRTLVLPVPVEPSGDADLLDGAAVDPRTPALRAKRSGSPRPVRDIAAITYAANPAKKGLDCVLDAWHRVRKPDERLVVAGASAEELARAGAAPHLAQRRDGSAAGVSVDALGADGVEFVGVLPQAEYRALLRRARVFVCAARREDHGIAQLEALADGCMLVSSPSPGPYVALPIARELDRRLIDDDLGAALRTALDDPVPPYHERALRALAPLRRAEVDRLVAHDLLPRLLTPAG